ncbi:hypothetical protein WAI453_004293 [Rhynchosporium graminicola]|uniref:Membrane insertase YidC/Oxa/ALB C-terminal domain-containing protein n=1 Tax=Rhynchosporium graminicola TaxID=2792576 RepID=A0A1E1JX20_9HELO|nr:uncharacterized protein RCO7_08645 [Rhynchosporium commune]
MIPSRGLRWSSQAIGIGRTRTQPLPARQFSSTPVQHRANRLLSNHRATLPGTTYKGIGFSQANIIRRHGASIRFASTTPLPASTIATQASSTTEVASSAASSPAAAIEAAPSSFQSSLNSATDFAYENISDIPERIGYLKELGLDFGWGPTSIMQYLLEHVHVYAGTPWWVSISLTAIAVRAMMLKPYMNAADNAAKMQTVMPITKPLTEKMQQAARAKDNALVMQIRSEVQMINRRAGISMWKSFVPLLQIFAGYGTFVLLRAMAKVPVPGLETGGFLWVYNLAIPDPIWALPLATSAVLHWVLRRGGDTGAMNVSPEIFKAMIWGMPLLSFLCTFWLPAAVQISFLVSTILSFGQATLFRKDWFRERFNMYPLPNHILKRTTPTKTIAAVEKPSPYRSDIRLSPRPPTNPVLSSGQLSSRFQSPVSVQKTFGGEAFLEGEAEENRKKGIVGGLTSEVKDTFQGVMGKAKEGMKRRNEDSASKQKMTEYAAYEAKRREEIKAEDAAEEAKREERIREKYRFGKGERKKKMKKMKKGTVVKK